MTAPGRPPELTAHAFQITQQVQWGDQDAFGHVNNVIYFRWFESARIEYFRQAGLGHAKSQGVGPILAAIRCDFKRQLTYPDTLIVTASIASVGRTSLKMTHLLYSQAHGAIAALGDSTIVMFDYTHQRPVLVSDEIRTRIDALEGRH